ncbi:MAG: hypothetical protein ACK559_09265, partial [bacterium]
VRARHVRLGLGALPPCGVGDHHLEDDVIEDRRGLGNAVIDVHLLEDELAAVAVEIVAHGASIYLARVGMLLDLERRHAVEDRALVLGLVLASHAVAL